jgi:hypothetical protein
VAAGCGAEPEGDDRGAQAALFWASQNGASVASLSKLYGTIAGTGTQGTADLRPGPEQRPCSSHQVAEIARNDPDKEMRKRAIFWLGQSNDPRAASALESILTGSK